MADMSEERTLVIQVTIDEDPHVALDGHIDEVLSHVEGVPFVTKATFVALEEE